MGGAPPIEGKGGPGGPRVEGKGGPGGPMPMNPQNPLNKLFPTHNPFAQTYSPYGPRVYGNVMTPTYGQNRFHQPTMGHNLPNQMNNLPPQIAAAAAAGAGPAAAAAAMPTAAAAAAGGNPADSTWDDSNTNAAPPSADQLDLPLTKKKAAKNLKKSKLHKHHKH